ncbi:MAG: nucleotidyl transferase AbiEii/AbiGii toxin family protein [Anaerolineae bacterium]|nr:MAG: nucleotidyl transferase AbiEii/AbiGii toxin family protein [Anaerolineae bacterium]
MLTKAQIQRMAQRNRIGMQVQERDYLQHLILWLLYSRGQELIFKGGTALRLVYGGNRYSEDLDFNGPDDLATLQAHWQEVIAGLEDFGVVAEIRNDWVSDVGYSFDISFQGPLYDSRDRSKGKVRIDVNRRPEVVETRRELVASEYDDVRPFVVTVLTLEHLMAEKIRALLVRGKPRDLYDLWLLLRQGVQPDGTLIERKLGPYEMTWDPDVLEEALEQVRADWERDLRPLLPQFVPYEVAYEGIQTLRNSAADGKAKAPDL